MASVAIPIEQITAASQFGTSLRRSPIKPEWIRRALLFCLFPRILSFITENLSGTRLGAVSAEQAIEMYGPLEQLYKELLNLLSTRNRSFVTRVLLNGWFEAVAEQTDEIGEILETLAWGSDRELRDFIGSSIASIDTLELPFADVSD
jgi:hypothetical protein